MSSHFSLTPGALPDLLPRHRREVVLLVIGGLALPHDEDDLQPLRGEGPEGFENGGAQTVQLLNRHWQITDARGRIQEVKGRGVVGEQPHLQPGEGFRYSSGAILETPVGAMQGKYRMVGDDGEHFDAPIAPFTLAMPGLLH